MSTNNISRVVGKADCVVCGEELPVKQNGRDTLNISCPWCGVSAYVKGGTQAHGIVSGWVRKSGSETAAPAKEKPAPAPAPASPLAAINQAVKKSATLLG